MTHINFFLAFLFYPDYKSMVCSNTILEKGLPPPPSVCWPTGPLCLEQPHPDPKVGFPKPLGVSYSNHTDAAGLMITWKQW